MYAVVSTEVLTKGGRGGVKTFPGEGEVKVADCNGWRLQIVRHCTLSSTLWPLAMFFNTI